MTAIGCELSVTIIAPKLICLDYRLTPRDFRNANGVAAIGHTTNAGKTVVGLVYFLGCSAVRVTLMYTVSGYSGQAF